MGLLPSMMTVALSKSSNTVLMDISGLIAVISFGSRPTIEVRVQRRRCGGAYWVWGASAALMWATIDEQAT